MWSKNYSKTFQDVKREAVWQIWTDVNQWPTWHGDLDACTMEVPFEVNSYFFLKPKGMKPVKVVVVEIDPGYSFTDCTTFLGAKMYNTHAVEETPEGLTFNNTLVVTGPLKWLWIWLVARNIAHSIPEETEALVRLAREKK